MCIYYHYTDRKGLKGILKSGTIKKSPTGRYGRGVYLTKLHPRHGREQIAQNNWDGIWQVTEMSGKVDYAISVDLPECKVKKFGQIYLFKEDVHLHMTSYRLYSESGDHRRLERACRKARDDSSSGSSSEEEDKTSSEDEEESSDDE